MSHVASAVLAHLNFFATSDSRQCLVPRSFSRAVTEIENCFPHKTTFFQNRRLGFRSSLDSLNYKHPVAYSLWDKLVTWAPVPVTLPNEKNGFSSLTTLLVIVVGNLADDQFDIVICKLLHFKQSVIILLPGVCIHLRGQGVFQHRKDDRRIHLALL